MNKFTIDDMLSLEVIRWEPWYSRSFVEDLWAGRESLALREILELDANINIRTWMILAVLSMDTLIQWEKNLDVESEIEFETTDEDYHRINWISYAHEAAEYFAHKKAESGIPSVSEIETELVSILNTLIEMEEK